MSLRGWVVGAVGGAVGVVAAGTAVDALRRPRGGEPAVRREVPQGSDVPLGSLHSDPITVIAEDGVLLHVEVDELPSSEPSRGQTRAGARLGPTPPELTVVFAHGFCLDMDCWHFQRLAYRGLVRTVFYDQRSHGRSGRSEAAHATIDQLALDLRQIIDEVVPEGPIVVVGHSMGGMTIVALAERFPELFGDRIIGAGLISTTAGGLDISKALLPLLPARLTGVVTPRAIAALSRGHAAIDTARRVGAIVANTATHRYAFGGQVPKSYIEFVDGMLARTPFEVVAEFFPAFVTLDKFHSIGVLERIPVSIVCGTADRLTSVGHSRKLHSRIAGSRLLECEGAGHMVIIERHDRVDAELDQLISAALARVRTR